MKIEVSNGEIVDKLTILELKRENAQTQEQARHIEEELNYLKPIVDGMDIPVDIIDQLREVNKRLWEVEDMLREYEKKGVFDRQFITFARAVYQTNNARFRLKSKVNELTNSLFVEEKIHPEI
tara:strand:- start:92 stop:460 length:369 start_codon:yes stop_codon:yes gene_type:complete